jgi:hypothetical protein
VAILFHFENEKCCEDDYRLKHGYRQCAIGMRVAAAIYHYSPVISASVSVVIIIEMSALGICFVL